MGKTAEMMMKHAVTAAIVDLDALASNYQAIAAKIQGNTLMTAVVKADGYGHGSLAVAKTALENGASRLAVARFSEAIELRKAGITAPILLFGYILPDNVLEAIRNNIIISVNSYSSASLISSLAEGKGLTAVIHIKTDTGMGRLGIVTDQISLHQGKDSQRKTIAEIKAITKLPGLKVEGLYTHFATADSVDKSYANQQFSLFQSLLKELKDSGISIDIIHCANSAASLEMPETHLDMIRPGIVQYGLWPSGETNTSLIDLKPVMSLSSTIIHIKEVPVGFKISYGATYETDRVRRIATVPLGYADGYSRQLSNKGMMLVGGKSCPIVGRVCMDLTMIDVTDVDCEVGERVVAIGSSKDLTITAEDLASLVGTINYEIVTSISQRVPRFYIKNGEVIDDFNLSP